MDPRQYLAALQRDLERLQTNTDGIVAKKSDEADAGITVKTTIGNKTTVARTSQKNVGTVEIRIGCLDFSRSDPHIPDGTYVNNVRLEEEVKTQDESASNTTKINSRPGNR